MVRKKNYENIKWPVVSMLVILSATFFTFTANAEGWDNSTGEWQYLDENGKPVTDMWKSSNGEYFFLGDDGYIVTDTLIEDDFSTQSTEYYYVDQNGAMVTNTWKPVALENEESYGAEYWWYYFGADGRAYKHTSEPVTINDPHEGAKYMFDDQGHMLFDLVDKNGNRLTSYTAEDIYNCQWYFGNWNDGVMKKKLWLDVTNDLKNEPEYQGYYSLKVYFQSDGKRAIEKTLNIGGKQYTFDSRGIIAYGNKNTGSSMSFHDVNSGAWYYDKVKWAYENGLMSGKSSTRFDPDGNLTRAEAVQVLYAAAGSPEPVTGTADTGFTDVPSNAWYTKAVVWARENQIASGKPYDFTIPSDFSKTLMLTLKYRLDPDVNITRQELAVMLKKFAEYNGKSTDYAADLSSFSDASSVASWAQEAVSWAHAAGVINGKGNNMIAPEANATRAEYATMIKGYYE